MDLGMGLSTSILEKMIPIRIANDVYTESIIPPVGHAHFKSQLAQLG